MTKHVWWEDLQLFAGEGAGTGDGAEAGGDTASAVPQETGVEDGDPGRQRLQELGVPQSKISKRASKAVSDYLSQRQTQAQQMQAAAAPQEDPPKAELPSWDEIMKNPEYNQKMQEIVQSRLKNSKKAEEHMKALSPALELLARKYNMDAQEMDFAALAKAISDDDSYYEERALEMGVGVEQAKRMDQMEREVARQQRQQEQTIQEQKIQAHFQSMEQQAEELRKVYPDFDLRKELKNPRFARMTSPAGGCSVQDAYFALHRQEIMDSAMSAAVRNTKSNVSKAIQSGSMRPQEAATVSQAPSITQIDPRKMTREQREELKNQIRIAAAEGRHIYPGQ